MPLSWSARQKDDVGWFPAKHLNSKALPMGRGEQSRACFGRKRQGRVDEQYLLLKESEGSGLWWEQGPRARPSDGGGTVPYSLQLPTNKPTPPIHYEKYKTIRFKEHIGFVGHMICFWLFYYL